MTFKADLSYGSEREMGLIPAFYSFLGHDKRMKLKHLCFYQKFIQTPCSRLQNMENLCFIGKVVALIRRD
jgi:hypothetical protein